MTDAVLMTKEAICLRRALEGHADAVLGTE